MNDKNIISAVEKRNITNIRSALKGNINEDMNFTKGVYNGSLNYILQHGITKTELFDQHDGTVFELNKEDWTREYFNNVMADLLFNFSEERINHIKQVGKHLFPPAVKSPQVVRTQTDLKKYLPLVLVVGVVILLIIAIIQRNK